MGKRRKWMQAALGVGLCTALLAGGCGQTAGAGGTDAENIAKTSGDDRLVGAFITDGYLVFPAAEEGDDRPLEERERIYATIDKKDSDDPSDWDISFKDISGVKMMSPCWPLVDGGDCWFSLCDPAVQDVRLNVTETDDGTKISISGTIYVVSSNDASGTYYANPVYETADGELYVQAGNGFANEGGAAEGGSFQMGLGDPESSGSVSLTYAWMNRPVSITVMQMDKNNVVLSRETYEPGTLPETLRTESGAAYLLVEIEKTDGDGNSYMERQLYDPSDKEQLITFYAMENGLMGAQDTTVEWQAGE